MSTELTGTEERAIIALALDEPTFFASIIDNIETDFFSLDEAKYVFKIIKFFYDNKGEIPTRELTRDMVEKTLSVDKDSFREILEICDHRISPRDYEIVKDRFIAWLRSKTLDAVYDDQIIESIKRGDYSQLESIVEKAANIQDMSGDCMWFFNDVKKLFVENFEEKLTSGFPSLDKYLNEGGPTKKETLVWMAPTGVGKCHSLQSRIIAEELSTIFELELENGTKIKLAGHREIKTEYGIVKVCDLTKEDNIVEIPFEGDCGDILLQDLWV